MKNLTDKNGIIIKKDFLVEVPNPNGTDIHNHEFVGSVKDTHDDYIIVEDSEGNCFDIEPERLEVIAGLAKTSKDITYDDVEKFADREQLNIETDENIKEAKIAFWNLLHPKEPKRDIEGNIFYEVVWRVNVYAKNSKEAAKQALEMQQDIENDACVFEVSEADESGRGGLNTEEIDLIDELE